MKSQTLIILGVILILIVVVGLVLFLRSSESINQTATPITSSDTTSITTPNPESTTSADTNQAAKVDKVKMVKRLVVGIV